MIQASPLRTLLVLACVAVAERRLAASVLVETTTVALSGEQAPGLPDGVVFSGFNLPSIGPSGEVAFRGILSGPGVTSANDLSAWWLGPNGLELVTRENGPTPDPQSGLGIERIIDVRLDRAGNPYFTAVLTGLPSTPLAVASVWSGDVGAVTQNVRSGDPLAGGGVLGPIRESLPIGPGRVLVTAGTASIRQVALTGPDGLKLLVEAGQPAPGFGELVFNRFDPFNTSARLSVNSVGEFVFMAEAQPESSIGPRSIGVWIGSEEGVTPLALEGGDAAGLPGATHDSFSRPVVNDSGQVAFQGAFDDPSFPFGGGSAIWAGSPGSLAPVVVSGDPVPGAPSGTTFDAPEAPVIGALGEVVFLAGERDENRNLRNGLWVGDTSGLRNIAYERDNLPGLDADVTLRSLVVTLSPHTGPLINGRGDVVFAATLERDDRFLGVGYWADLDGQLVKIAAAGDTIDVADDPLVEDLRVINSLTMIRGTGPEDGHASGWNNRREAAFDVFFADGSEGIVVFTVVPEPASALLAVLVAITPTAACRRSPRTGDPRSTA